MTFSNNFSLNNRTAVLLWLCIPLSLPIQGLITAAEETARDVTELSLEELMNIPVYAASKRLQTVSEAPAYVTIVTREEIKKYGYRTLSLIINMETLAPQNTPRTLSCRTEGPSG